MLGCLPSATEMTQIRADVLIALDLDCTIKRKTTTTHDGMGSSTESYTTIATVKCGKKQPNAGLLQMYASRIGTLATSQIALPTGTDVRLQDQLIIDGSILMVQALLTPQSFSVYTNVLASQVE